MPNEKNMDIRARGVLRTAFTKKLKHLEDVLAQDEKDFDEIKGLLVLLEKKQDELQGFNRRVQMSLIEDDRNDDGTSTELEEEINTADDYDLKWYKIKARCGALMKEDVTDAESQGASGQCNVSMENRRQFKLPTLELKKFNGELREWLPFWSQFKKIDEDTFIDKADKFQYLIQATVIGSRARELVESFPPTCENYEKAIECLKNRFGRDDLLVEVYVRELLGLVLNNTMSSKKISLASLYDKLECKLRALETLKVTSDKCASMLMPLVESCLPEDTLRAWQRSPFYMTPESIQGDSNLKHDEENGTCKTDIPKHRLTHLMKFLRAEIENDQKIKLALNGFGMKRDDIKKDRNTREMFNFAKKNMPTAAGLLATTAGFTCVFCDGKHFSSECAAAKKMGIADKRKILDKKGCCYRCLLKGHRVATCRSNYRCMACGRRHHALICEYDNTMAYNTRGGELKEKSGNVRDNVLANIDNFGKIVLQTFRVKLKGKSADRIVRAIIDTGSQRSYVLRDVVEDMKYEPVRKEKIRHTLFGGLNTNTVEHDVFTIPISDLNETYCGHFEMLDQPVICGRIEPLVPGPWLRELRQFNIELSDFEDTPIEVLLGADAVSKLFTGKQYMFSGLLAVETRLGWTLVGCFPKDVEEESLALMSTASIVKDVNIADLWSLDVLGIMDPTEKKKKEQLQLEAQQHFLKTVTVDEEGRYLVHLPWIENHQPLSDNYNLSLKRLNTTVKKLKAGGYYDEYGAVLKEWIAEGIIEEVSPDDMKEMVHYLPHRHVIKLNSTTKIRPVFDASAKEKNSPSLNNCLEKGPNLIEMLPVVLMRFRIGKIGVISDIKKAFLQISLSIQDRDFLRFLWYDEQGQLKIYRHRRVVFGVSCSPFLLGAVIQYHLKCVAERRDGDSRRYSTDVLEKMFNCFYVDNCVTSLDKKEELENFIAEATDIMKEGGFELRGWEYSVLDAETKNDACELSHVLGMIWNRGTDTLKVNLDNFNSFEFVEITKRVVLSAAHRIFDPIGVVCPVLLLPKLMLQKIWMKKLNWDQPIDEDDNKLFVKWKQELALLQCLEIPRWIIGVDDPVEYTIHVFNDASQHAYATAIFLRVQTCTETRVQLIQAKSRISPIGKTNKRMTIPRLELLAANMGVRLHQSIIKDLNVPIDETFFWSDSTTVLAWIAREEQWDVFVRNRVMEIKNLTLKKQWHYVPGIYNPADLPSRGCSAKKLVESQWWNGPDWLMQPSYNWSSYDILYDEDEINEEKKKTIISSTMLTYDDENGEWYYRYFSKYKQIVRLIGWLLRFKLNCSKKRELRLQSELTVEEIKEAEIRLFQLVQKRCFKGVDDPRLNKFQSYIGTDGLIRLRTKISFGDYEEDFCYPIVLPDRRHPVVQRLIMDFHSDSSHAGSQILMSILRKRFWIMGGRRTVRAVLNRCMICKRYSAKRMQVQAPPLPVDRIRDAKIFEIVGIDLAGPLYIKTGQKGGREKIWICLFTCAVYRAVHLELITSLSAERFIICLRKFISRRGRPSAIYTDNGTNFVGAANALSRIDWNKVQMYGSVKKIKWKFNPPTAAWWGGWWERLIGLVKQLLRKILGRTSLDFDEMQAVLCECEAVVNSRPLTYASEDPADLTPLTPDLFLKELEEIGVTDLDVIEIDLNRRAKYRQQLRQMLKRRFQDEYLGSLMLYGKKNFSRNIRVGDLVLVENENLKRTEWPLARVNEIIPGREGTVRLVRLKTSAGFLLRPVQRLFLMEMDINQQADSVLHDIRQRAEHVERTKQKMDKKDIQADLLVEEPKVTRRGRLVRPPRKLDL